MSRLPLVSPTFTYSYSRDTVRCSPCLTGQISSLHPGFYPWQQHPGLFQTNQCKPPSFQTYTVMNILIRSGPVAGQDLAQRTPRGPQRSQSSLSTRVTGDYDAGHIFHYHPLRRDSTTRATGWLLIPHRFSLFTTSESAAFKRKVFNVAELTLK